MVMLTCADYSSAIFEQVRNLQQLNESFDERLALDSGTSEVLQEQTNLIHKTDADIQVLKNNSFLSREETRDALSGIRERVDQLPNIATGQFEILKAMIEKLQAQVAAQPREPGPSSKPTKGKAHSEAPISGPIDGFEYLEGSGDNQYQLQESIKRLCSLAEREGSVLSDESEFLVEDLNSMLDAVLKQISNPAGPSSDRKRKLSNARGLRQDDIEAHRDDERDVKRIKGLLNVSFEVALNQPGMVRTACPWILLTDMLHQHAVSQGYSPLNGIPQTADNDPTIYQRVQ